MSSQIISSQIHANPCKSCVSCKYFSPSYIYFTNIANIRNGKCMHPNTKYADVITGKVSYPSIESSRYNGQCSQEAILYEEETNSFVRFQNQYPIIVTIIMLIIFLMYMVSYIVFINNIFHVFYL